MFKLQIRDHNRKWRDLRFAGPSHSHIETAISAACALDQDGLFTSDVRITDLANKVVYTSKDYRPEHKTPPPDRIYTFIGPDGREYDADRNPVRKG
jgi:hypothetical protein